MTYRRKLLLRRLGKILLIAAAIILVLGIIGFVYLSRYIVYDLNGSHFSMGDDAAETETLSGSAAEDLSGLTITPIESPVMITGTSIQEEVLTAEEQTVELLDTEVNGLYFSYDTLMNGDPLTTLNNATEEYNTLVLELRTRGSEVLNNSTVQSIISYAQDQEMQLVAILSCCDDSAYALEHGQLSMQITGGALWIGDSGTYWLNPGEETVQSYFLGFINEAVDMGFDQIILKNFLFPTSSSIINSLNGSSEWQITYDAFQSIYDQVSSYCKLGIYVTDSTYGHAAEGIADRVYVYLSDASDLNSYREQHEGEYIVFITSSHDTRFNDCGKIYSYDPIDD